ncbi:acyl-homoserine-lactone synthase [Variovorax sp. KK3]|uniref:acyl-homoserine-lactone synthase n=1 Tax=Variovorax sp. KK3 TaxID=1855728 RepID=UPI00097C5FDC|nr:acyl-homoserine-lactone synthase [Variovorax sp. KK3]
MEFTAGTSQCLSEAQFVGLGQYRHKVFVETLGWDVPTRAGLELDQFDRPDTIYVLARNHGKLVGVARLLPTLRPYLLDEVFPHLMGDARPPKSAEVWELSRFAAVGCQSRVPSGHLSTTALELLRAVQDCALRQGASRLIMVTALGVERLLRNAGYCVYRAGPPQVVDGQPVLACWIELQPSK